MASMLFMKNYMDMKQRAETAEAERDCYRDALKEQL
jgi:hypothetical protein